MISAFDLERFVEAQSGVYARALREIRSGQKVSHWMWFIFPQLAGLGASAMARLYGIRSLEEASRYLDHPLLGNRYQECTKAVHDLVGTSAQAVFGPLDAMKLRSSLTLFAQVSDNPLYKGTIQQWFDGGDPMTTHLLANMTGPPAI